MMPFFDAMVHPVLFYTLSALSVAGALGVVLARHPVYSVLSLVVTLFGLSAMFTALHAPFVAMVQILVYAGAILILFLFVVMLLDISPETLLRTRSRTSVLAGSALALLFLAQLGAVVCPSVSTFSVVKTPLTGNTAAIGEALFTGDALPFEVASFLLLAGIIGAIVLAKKKL